MAADPGNRRRLRRDSLDSSLRRTPSTKDRKIKRSVKPIKERWLLTRKTWRYMADAGRRLIPEGTHNRPEDIPKIEQTFQEVCQKEPRFLLWRKSSYPGSLTFCAHRRRQIGKNGSYRTYCQASSADEADDSRSSPQSFNIYATTAGKFDLTKAKRESLLLSGGSGSGSTPSSPEAHRKMSQENTEEDDLIFMLQKYLFVKSNPDELALINLSSEQPVECAKTTQTGLSLDHRSLVNKLQRYVDKLVDEAKERSSDQSCTGEKDAAASSSCSHIHVVRQQLVETLSRYYGKFSFRDHVISDILTDRKLLEKMYFDLKCSTKFRMPRCASSWWLDTGNGTSAKKKVDLSSLVYQLPKNSCQVSVQTNPVSQDVLDACLLEKEKEQSSRRRSSVDDVSPSVGDTIKRYLRMARKKSIDADKDDRFKRVNYDRLLLTKKKGTELKVSDDSGNSKGCQTEDDWAVYYREMFFPTSEYPSENLSDIDATTSPPSRNASSRSSIDAGSEEVLVHVKYPHQSFLSHLLHVSNAHKDKSHSAPGSPALTSSTANSTGGTAMQKSKSSSSVVHQGSRLVAKKIWRSRSKSISRTIHQPFVWTPQGKCTWAGTGGRRITLQDVPLRSLSEIERKILYKVAVAKLQALNLGVHIKPPNESLRSGFMTTKPKKRAYLLKRKALTTSFFDNKEKDASVGLVFGIPLSQCLENDRIARIAAGEVTDVGILSRNSRHGSRTSFSSLTETSATITARTEEEGSSESLSSKGTATLGGDSGMLELSDSGGSAGSEWDTVPNIVRQCIWHLENTGFQTLGVFRVSSSKKRVRELRENFDCGRETKIGLDQCPHDVATLLKEYFRDLPDPLLCRELYQAFVHTQKIRNRRLQQEALQHLIQLLPIANRDTLWTLLTFLNDVAKYSQDYKTKDGEWLPGNKMDKTNLATVFAPNILHCVKSGQVRSEISSERAEERVDVINVVRMLLEHTSSLFTVPAALLDEVYQHMIDTYPAELDIALSRRIEEQSENETDLCSEAETVEETLTMSTTIATKETSMRKMLARDQCLHQTVDIGSDIGPKARRSKRPGNRRKEDSRSDSIDSGSSEDPSDTRQKSSSTVITASLTIPMSDAFSLSLDIPYIEETSKQSSIALRQRQRSISGYREAGRHGSDSNTSSLTTQSSDQPLSSPPSWTSSSPTSPDSSGNTVSYIPDQQAILQKVSFTISSEVKQVNKSDSQQEMRKSTPSITSIGGVVMRSKTADIERMLKISGSNVKSITHQTTRNPSVISSDSKKYTKRRYTDSRHPTRHIPDSNSLTDKMSSAPLMTPSSSTTQNQCVPVQSVWKRRELISSTPGDKYV